MKQLNIKLENCYGIRKLEKELSFQHGNTLLFYAPNGVMKTSFAKTFDKISQGKEPEEKLHGRKPSYLIHVDGSPIAAEQILVVKPFDAEFESKNVSTLLVNSEKKAVYDSLYREIINAKQKLVAQIAKLSKLTKDVVERKICEDTKCQNIFDAIRYLTALPPSEEDFSGIKYAELFEDKVTALLSDPEVEKGIAEYADRYNYLLGNSSLYKKGTFTPTNADVVSKTLRKERFFEANHKLLLNGETLTLGKPEDFELQLDKARENVFKDTNLKSIHEKLIGGVAAVKSFQSILESHPFLPAYLKDIEKLKESVWLSYYRMYSSEFDDVLERFDSKRKELKAIEDAALLEETMWHEAKVIFKKRFHVPFDIDVQNHTNAILGSTAPNIVFTFVDEDGAKKVFDRGQLHSLDILSIGERRAMYLLYIIFEFKARIQKGDPVLVIVDDIADSFDYKNKYAIIEYLREMSLEASLRFIVLTHNFDFYRTFQGRVLASARWKNSFVAQKNGNEVVLLDGGNKELSSPFEVWRKGYGQNAAMFVSMIPFVRNLIEYREGTAGADYLLLTSMLHLKNDSGDLTLGDLQKVIASTISNSSMGEFDPATKVLDFILSTAESVSAAANDSEIKLENKIVLSIAARLIAEKFMLSNVTNKAPFSKDQTFGLFQRLMSEDVSDKFSSQKKTLSQVLLMTSENIHLNSFMYEPLLDMSCMHLVTLYQDLKAL